MPTATTIAYTTAAATRAAAAVARAKLVINDYRSERGEQDAFCEYGLGQETPAEAGCLALVNPEGDDAAAEGCPVHRLYISTPSN